MLSRLDVEKFQDDVYAITELLSERLDSKNVPKLNFVRQRLIDMYKENLVKINHSVLELICASELIAHGILLMLRNQFPNYLHVIYLQQNPIPVL